MVADAHITDLARHLEARAKVEGIVFGDWSYMVGTGGFNPLTPATPNPVNTASQVLSSPVGGRRRLGRVTVSGTGAALTVHPNGYPTVTGLSSLPALGNKYLVLSGSADPLVNGAWRIGGEVDPTTVQIDNPLVTTSATGLLWEIREACLLFPNASANDFQCRVSGSDPIDDLEIGEIGIFCRVLRSPSEPVLVGQDLLYCAAHMTPRTKITGGALTEHVCLQN